MVSVSLILIYLSYPLIIRSKLLKGFSFSSDIKTMVSLFSKSESVPILLLSNVKYSSFTALLMVY